MRPCPRSLLPSSVFIYWGCYHCERPLRASMPLNTLTHPVSITSITLHAGFTGLSSFRLVPVSTVPSIDGLHLRKHTATGVTHHHPAWHTSHIFCSKAKYFRINVKCSKGPLVRTLITHSPPNSDNFSGHTPVPAYFKMYSYFRPSLYSDNNHRTELRYLYCKPRPVEIQKAT